MIGVRFTVEAPEGNAFLAGILLASAEMSLVGGLDFEVGCQEPMGLVRLKIGNLGDKPDKFYRERSVTVTRLPWEQE